MNAFVAILACAASAAFTTTAHADEPADLPDHQPGRDARGRPVAPADLEPGPRPAIDWRALRLTVEPPGGPPGLEVELPLALEPAPEPGPPPAPE